MVCVITTDQDSDAVCVRYVHSFHTAINWFSNRAIKSTKFICLNVTLGAAVSVMEINIAQVVV